MGLIDRLRSYFVPPVEREFWPFVNVNGHTYPIGLQQTLLGQREEIGSDFTGLGNGALKSNPVVFACMLARASLFSEARFMYRQVRSGTPGDLFSKPELEILRHPWAGATTGDLLSRTMQDADLAGNAFWVRKRDRLVRLRPDWVSFIHGSERDPQMDMWDPEAVLLGYMYQPGGPGLGRDPIFYDSTEVAHFAPTPDPIAPHRGMSWLTPLIREIAADSAMTSHKWSFLVNGATPNLVVTGVPSASKEEFEKWVALFEGKHKGATNAYKSLYLSPTMDAKVIGSDMAQIDFKAVQGLGETRIAAAAGVPAAVVGISEGLQGSSLNTGNFGAAMRRFADLTMRPAWRNVCGSFERIIVVPPDAELWYDDRDIPALKDDMKDAAQVQQLQAQAIRQYVDAGFEPDSVVKAIKAGDLAQMTHTGLYSVQLQPPQPEGPPEVVVKPVPQLTAGRELRCTGCHRLLAERAGDGTRIACGRCGTVNETAERTETPQVLIGPGAIHVEVHAPEPAPPPQVTIAEGAFRFDNPTTFSEGAFQTIIAEGAIAPAPVNVTIPERSVEPAQVHIAEGAVSLVNKPPTRVVFDRDENGKMIGVHDEPLVN
jgi:phage portal protein BeeE/phage FluMu protein Com